MQHSVKKSQRRIPGRNTIREKDTINAQSKTGKNVSGARIVSEHKFVPGNESLSLSPNTQRFNTAGLNIDIKLGYEIIKFYGISPTFTLDNKIRAALIYKCIRHLPGFIDQKFDNADTATAYIFKSAYKLLGTHWGLIPTQGEHDMFGSEMEKMPDDKQYAMQIVYNEFTGEGIGRWQSLAPIPNLEKKVRKAILMCLHIIVMEFKFHIFDIEYADGVGEFEEYVMNERDNLEEQMKHYHDEFIKENKRPYSEKLDTGTVKGQDIYETQTSLMLLDEEEMEHERIAKPLVESIRKIKPNLKFINSIINETDNPDLKYWLSHILNLKKSGFCIYDYIGNAWRYIDDSYEDAGNPMGIFGYIFDGDSGYSNYVNQYFNDYANNSCVVPFCINTVIDPVKGIVFKTEDKPIGKYIIDIFTFNFNDLKYEK